ncbi:MAG: ATP synthase subunit I [Candidatus Methylomirabilales bacterium]
MKRRAKLWRFWSGEALSGGTDAQGDPEALACRIRRIALILTGGGFLFCLLFGGWSWALGYGIGGGIGMTNLELLRQTVSRAFASETGKALPRLVRGSILRLLGIGIVLFLVLKFLPVQVLALALGLLVVQVAIVVAGYPRSEDLQGGA